MSRLVSEDFNKLCSFITSYSLTGILENKEVVKLLSTYHKKYYGYLVFMEKLHQAKEENEISESQYDFLQESCSDIGQAFFLLFHGCYKGAKLLLRSSIENFLKGICLDEDPSLPKTKSVYEIFDKAKLTTVFSDVKISLHDTIHNEYALLCQDVHTADKTHMASVTALNNFPSFDKKQADIVTKFVLHLEPVYMTLLALKFNNIYHKMNPLHKEVTNKEILNDFKKSVHNVE